MSISTLGFSLLQCFNFFFVDIILFGISFFHLRSVGTFSSYLQHTFGEGNGTPLQYSCLENPVDGGGLAPEED